MDIIAGKVFATSSILLLAVCCVTFLRYGARMPKGPEWAASNVLTVVMFLSALSYIWL